MRRPRPRPRLRSCTCTGPSMRFSSTVLCGNRLCDWKTMPLRERSATISRRRAFLSLGSVLKSTRGVGDPHGAGVRGLQHVERAQHGRLARAGRPEQRGRACPRPRGEVDAAEHMVVAEGLLEPATSISGRGRPCRWALVSSCGEPLQSSSRAVPGRARSRSRSPSSRARRARRAAGTRPLERRPRSGASRNSSGTRTTETSEVSLTSESSVFDSGGTAIRAACGSTMRRMLCQ